VTTLRFVVGTVIGPIQVCVSSELIIAAIATDVQSEVGGGFEILENSFGGGEMAGERTGIVHRQKCKLPIRCATRTRAQAQLIASFPWTPARRAAYSQL